MDYNDFELVAFWVLCFLGALVPLVTGVLLHRHRGASAMGWYLFLGILGSIAYGYCAGLLLNQAVPPPYVPGLSEGRGLDLRGMGLIIGSWIGGVFGVLATVLTFAVSTIVRWNRRRGSGRRPENSAAESAPNTSSSNPRNQ